jgi:hypothetical protein
MPSAHRCGWPVTDDGGAPADWAGSASGLRTLHMGRRPTPVDGRRVRLEGFAYQDQNVIHVTGSNRGRISLLVIPPETADTAGHDALMTAARRGDADRPEEILTASCVPAPRQAT